MAQANISFYYFRVMSFNCVNQYYSRVSMALEIIRSSEIARNGMECVAKPSPLAYVSGH